MLMDWKDEYSVGVKEIDTQHMIIFKNINELYASIQDNSSSDVLFKVLDNLADYSVYHFATEEKYFDKFDFKGALAHKKEHASFKKKISSLIADAKAGKVTVSFELVDFLEDWIIDHVTGIDHEYIDCFKEHGLK